MLRTNQVPEGKNVLKVIMRLIDHRCTWESPSRVSGGKRERVPYSNMGFHTPLGLGHSWGLGSVGDGHMEKNTMPEY